MLPAMRWVSVEEVYADGAHNAWPDLCRWRGRYWLVFPAHAEGHGLPHGLVVLSSADGSTWESSLDITAGEWQIEADEKWPAQTVFFLPTDERLIMVFWSAAIGDDVIPADLETGLRARWFELGGGEDSWARWVMRHGASNRTRVTYTEDGVNWAQPVPLLEPGWWFWRPHTFDGRHYMIGFLNHAQLGWTISSELESMIPRADSIAPLDRMRGQGMELFQSASMFASDDGVNWTKVSDIANNDDDEPDFNFGPDGRILAVSRNGAAMKHAIAYLSDPPYREWRELPLAETIHQPAVVFHRDHWIVGGRYFDEPTYGPNRFDPEHSLEGRIGTRLWYLDEATGVLTEGVTLPSWGDCGQPSILPTPEGDLLVAYYSCSETIDQNLPVGGGRHPGKFSPCSIYLARVVIDA